MALATYLHKEPYVSNMDVTIYRTARLISIFANARKIHSGHVLDHENYKATEFAQSVMVAITSNLNRSLTCRKHKINL